MSAERAVRYRRLAMAEADPVRARLLQMLADEAERGVLHAPEPTTKIVGHQPPKPIDLESL